MGWRVVYLDGKEGREFFECDICREVGRYPIEPAVIFVPVWRYSEYEKKKVEAKAHFTELKQREAFLRDSFLRIFKKELDGLRRKKTKKACIFHCEKENEVWIENIEEYRQWKEERNRVLEGNKNFSRDIEIRWNRSLIEEFWRRIRAYRFAVDYLEFWKNSSDWSEFLGVSTQVCKNFKP